MLHEALGGDGRAVLIGHDWGAMATYGAVAYQPERWRKAVTAAVPPAGALLTGFLSYEQLKLSWYTFFFQTPLAEAAVAADDLAFLTRLWQDWSPGYDPSWDLARVRQSLSDPARLAAAITYYRALYDPRLQVPHLAEIQSAATAPTPRPTLYLHGAHDGCVKVELAKTALQYLAEGSQVSVVPDAGHFLHLEKPAEVNAKILAFVSS
jgi:pimeloyl-ACP methyl ester carboxylesterase